MDKALYSFPPVSDQNSRILILGSMPGEESLRKRQYYAHPRNQFWPILSRLLGFSEESDYRERLAALLRNRIALWDVIESCNRQGSLDSAIQNIQVNDFRKFFFRHPMIKTVYFNGRKAFMTFKKVQGIDVSRFECRILPSTSPAYTMLFNEKLTAWKQILGSL